MVREKELDELYEEVKEDREMFAAEIDYEYIRESVKDILEHFKSTKCYATKVEKIIIVMSQVNLKGKWAWSADDSAVLQKEFSKLNVQEEEYFEKLLQKYCNIRKTSNEKWELTLK